MKLLCIRIETRFEAAELDARPGSRVARAHRRANLARINDTQRVNLSTAEAREDLRVLPLPRLKTPNGRGASNHQFAGEGRNAREGPHIIYGRGVAGDRGWWSSDARGYRSGLRAVGIEDPWLVHSPTFRGILESNTRISNAQDIASRRTGYFPWHLHGLVRLFRYLF